MNKIDQIIHAGKLLTVDPQNTILEDYSLAINGGDILDILPRSEIEQRYEATEICDRSTHTLMPGLINAHTHLPMNLMRGLADDLPLKSWLQDHIWPTESRWVSPEFVAAGTRLALAESLLGGVTCCNDMYFFPEIVAEQAKLASCRVVVGMLIIDFPSAWAESEGAYLQQGLELHDKLREDPLTTTTFAPHSPYAVSVNMLEKIGVLSAELDVPIHMHIHETETEVEEFQAKHGRRPIALLDDIGLLNPAMMAVHMTQLLPEEIERISETGVNVLHCPESNMKLASGAAPISNLHRLGVNIAVGTDGAASNNDLDMLGEIRTAAMLAKLTSADASSISATEAIRMATINGAKALGLGNRIGSLEVGKAADIIAIENSSVGRVPLYNPASQIVYATDRQCVEDVWIAGKAVVRDRQLLTLDERQIVQESQSWAEQLQSGES